MDGEDGLERLRAHFDLVSASGAPALVMNFDEIADLLGEGLPQDAYLKKAWWTSTRQPHVAAWKKQGWTVEAVGFRMRRASFRRSA